jgi:hypothetical protein
VPAPVNSSLRATVVGSTPSGNRLRALQRNTDRRFLLHEMFAG